MKTKEKIKKDKIFYWITCTIILLISLLFYDLWSKKNRSYAETNAPTELHKMSSAEFIDLEEIIQRNQQEEMIEEYVQEEEILEYITKYQTNPEIPKGISYVVQQGRTGKQVLTKKRTYQKGQLLKEVVEKATVTKASFEQIVEIGGGSYESHHQVKKGDELWVTSDELAVRFEPKEESEKLATLSRKDKVKVIEMTQNWYKIICGSIIGYVKQECTTYFTKEKEKDQQEQNSLTKQQLKNKLNFQMALNEPSGLTLSQFQKVLTDSKDKNQIFQSQAQYFYYIEKQYQINGIFIAAIGVHESAWGTSKIAKEKKNLFGYGAYDSNPYQGAYEFSTYAESIDLMAKVLTKYYLNPKGTSIYGGETAVGTYYYGNHLTSVNKSYATDKNWANAVYSYMQYFYNKL